MSPEQQKEQFSIAYVRAVAAVAGVKADRPETDDDSVDVRFSIKSVAGSAVPPLVEAQLKCTSDTIVKPDGLHFELRRKNYDELRGERVIPRYLIVVLVSPSQSDWLEQTPDQLILRKCAYWCSLCDLPETANRASITVLVPAEQVFTVQALQAWLAQEPKP